MTYNVFGETLNPTLPRGIEKIYVLAIFVDI